MFLIINRNNYLFSYIYLSENVVGFFFFFPPCWAALNRDLTTRECLECIRRFCLVQPAALIHVFALLDHLVGGALEIFLGMTHPKIPFKNLEGTSHSFAFRMSEILQLWKIVKLILKGLNEPKGPVRVSLHLFSVSAETGVKHTVQFSSLCCCFSSATSLFCAWELQISTFCMEAKMFSPSNTKRYYIVET